MLHRSQEAVNYFDKALELNPNHVDAWNNKGVALANLGKHEEAIVYYDKALVIKPGDFGILVNKHNALSALGKA